MMTDQIKIVPTDASIETPSIDEALGRFRLVGHCTRGQQRDLTALHQAVW